MTAAELDSIIPASPEPASLALGRGAETTMGPDTAQGAQIGNDGLGGGGVEGAPLQMAAMIATIANEGRAVQPSLVTAVRRPGFHRTESVTGAQSQRSARPLRTLCVPR
jgi:cell division protein FtsI/penicillin-binding protein 2